MSKCTFCGDSRIGCMDIPGKEKICICDKIECQQKALDIFNKADRDSYNKNEW